MPRYRYECSVCGDAPTLCHAYGEYPGGCECCRATNCMERLYNEAFSVNKKNKKKEEKTGTITKQHIEENREILKDMQEEARSSTHEPT